MSTDSPPRKRRQQNRGLRIVALDTAIIAGLAAVVSCTTASREVPAATEPIRSTATRPADAAATAKARADSARYPYTLADIRFMSAMLVHHAQAVTMSSLAPARAASSSVKILAERIAASQVDEIASVEQWLRDRGHAMTHDMTTHGTHDMPMKGMITQSQLDQLRSAKGADFDRLFLTLMIQHHRGAVSMVKELFETSGAAQDETVFKFASDVSADQNTEIARMERMLTSLNPPR